MAVFHVTRGIRFLFSVGEAPKLYFMHLCDESTITQW